MTEAAIFVVFPLCLAFAAISDFFTMSIPNRVSAILGALFLPIALMAGFGPEQIVIHYAAGLLVFSVCFGLFALNAMGGGDAKLLSSSAVWFGFNSSLVEYIVFVGFLGGVLTMVVLFLRSHSNAILASGLPLPDHILTAKKVPYGVAIGCAGFLTYPSSPLMLAVFGSL